MLTNQDGISGLLGPYLRTLKFSYSLPSTRSYRSLYNGQGQVRKEGKEGDQDRGIEDIYSHTKTSSQREESSHSFLQGHNRKWIFESNTVPFQV